MLFENKSKEQIARYLYEIEGQRMGLTVGSAPGEHREDVASMLIAHYECLKDRAQPITTDTNRASAIRV